VNQQSQPTRLLILLVYLLVLFVTCKLAFGFWFPPTSEKGLWFYSGLAAILLGNLLVTPFFTKPVDAISYAVAALITLLAVNVWVLRQYTSFDRFLWSAAIAYAAMIVISGILSITLKSGIADARQKASRSLYLFCDAFGSPRAIFSMMFLFSVVCFHRSTVREYLIISLAWALVIGMRPLENAAHLVRRIGEIWNVRFPPERVGDVMAHHNPGVVLIRQSASAAVSFGEPLILCYPPGPNHLGMALDSIGFCDGNWRRAIHLTSAPDTQKSLAGIAKPDDSVACLALPDVTSSMVMTAVTDPAWLKRSSLIGLVAPGTNISRLVIDIVRIDLDIEEGRLVEVSIGDKRVLYQVVDGVTKEEIIQQKDTRGYVRAEAKKIGTWNDDLKRFEIMKWIPQPNAPVFLVELEPSQRNREAIGYVPGTPYLVSIEPRSLVTHNAAILGVLGSGKSFLALELIERLISANIKVICFDLTNQYAEELGPLYDGSGQADTICVLREAGPPGRDNVQQNVEEGGSIQRFKQLVRDHLSRFLIPEITDRVLIFNPAEFEVWRQDSKPFSGRASMVALTPTEITRVFTEAALEVVQSLGMSEEARCCLVFEEAHSLIPEWNAVASEGDRTATNGTAKAILQGRKYGMGCLIVTQRTANVTKSILNQCNTVFALRVFDATGMEFLKNYIGEDYAGVLSTLEDRHAVVFGRASSCRSPILVRLNDRQDFLLSFRSTTESSKAWEGP
jgi:hypothetical protein